MFENLRNMFFKDYGELHITIYKKELREYLKKHNLTYRKFDEDSELPDMRKLVIRLINGKMWLYLCGNEMELNDQSFQNPKLIFKQNPVDLSIEVLLQPRTDMLSENNHKLFTVPFKAFYKMSDIGMKPFSLFQTSRSYEKSIAAYKKEFESFDSIDNTHELRDNDILIINRFLNLRVLVVIRK